MYLPKCYQYCLRWCEKRWHIFWFSTTILDMVILRACYMAHVFNNTWSFWNRILCVFAEINKLRTNLSLTTICTNLAPNTGYLWNQKLLKFREMRFALQFHSVQQGSDVVTTFSGMRSFFFYPCMLCFYNGVTFLFFHFVFMCNFVSPIKCITSHPLYS